MRATLVGQHDTSNHGARSDDDARRHASSVAGTVAGDPLVQGVGVEERAAVCVGRGGDDVVQRALDEVGVRGVAGGEQQPPREHDRADAGAGLGVGAVGRAASQSSPNASSWWWEPMPAGEVGAARDGVVPLAARAASSSVVVAGLDGDVDRAGREVVGADGVPAQHRRRRGRARRPGSRRGPTRCPASVPCRAARRTARPGRGSVARPVTRASSTSADLDLGVPADATAIPSGAERRRTPGRRRGGRSPTQAVVGAGRVRSAGDGGLEQVAEAVELVAPLEVGPPRPLTGRGRSSC